MATIAVRDLARSYGAVRAVDGISFSVAEGEVFALLGPNGAGKTTTVEILEDVYLTLTGERDDGRRRAGAHPSIRRGPGATVSGPGSDTPRGRRSHRTR